jgi:predicted PurR-regulated permease PerM
MPQPCTNCPAIHSSPHATAQIAAHPNSNRARRLNCANCLDFMAQTIQAEVQRLLIDKSSPAIDFAKRGAGLEECVFADAICQAATIMGGMSKSPHGSAPAKTDASADAESVAQSDPSSTSKTSTSAPKAAASGLVDLPPKTRLEQGLSVVTLGFLLIGCFVVMRPFLSALMWAVVLGFTLWPVHSRLARWLGNRRTLAASLTTLSIAVVLVVPFVVLGLSVADDARALAAATRKWSEGGLPAPPSWLERIPVVGVQAKEYWEEFDEDLETFWREMKQPLSEVDSESVPGDGDLAGATPASASFGESRLANALRKLFAWAQSWLPSVGLAIGRGITEVALSVFLAFFILRDGAAVADRLATGVDRIAGARGRHLLEVAGSTVRGVVYGILGTALVQGGMAAVGFLMAGVPGATLLGLLTFFLSVVPMGPPLVWVPAVIWLYQQGSTGLAIFMLIWGLLVSSVDNLVKPWLISQGSNLPFILIFFGVIGGALAFGVIGVFLGPTLLAVAYRLVEEWSATRELPVTKGMTESAGGN